MSDDNTTYKERMKYFTDCYDTQNPLTAKEGRLRMIRAEMERGEGDEELMTMLKAKLEATEQQTAANAMQAYNAQARARAFQYQQQF